MNKQIKQDVLIAANTAPQSYTFGSNRIDFRTSTATVANGTITLTEQGIITKPVIQRIMIMVIINTGHSVTSDN